MERLILVFLCVSCSLSAYAQVDSTTQNPPELLQTVYLADNKLQNFSVGQTLHHFSDSVITHNGSALTKLLAYNSVLYFKENGLGMVSSPAFRGTTAAQTAVLWNGLNINSNFNGQTDFNTIYTGAYDHIDVRSGGGSLAFGSGAIGGTVHLNTELNYKSHFDNRLYLSYGSFDTYNARYRLSAATDKLSFKLNVAHNASDNDYKFQMRDGHNQNGEFQRSSLNMAAGYKLNKNNRLSLYSSFYDSDRHFPIYHDTEVPTKYKDFNTRNLLEWNSEFGAFSSRLKAALLSEHYKYYADAAKQDHTFGQSEDFIGTYDLNYKASESLYMSLLLAHKHTKAKGSDIERNKRAISSVGVLFKQQLISRLRYQLGVRKEITTAYGSPFLYDLGVEYDFTSFYTAKLSASKNFRRPTFNDLYWTNSGNTELEAETAYQVELGNTFKYKNWNLSITGYFNDINEMIHWLPASNGLFKPVNEDQVQTYGVETALHWKRKLGKHNLQIDGTYAYTVSKDKETSKQLIYVPYHKTSLSAVYGFGRFSFDYQLLYNGDVFLHTDNNPNHILSGYPISNLGLTFRLDQKGRYRIGGKVRNLFNKAYENTRRYEMPGINYKLFLILNF